MEQLKKKSNEAADAAIAAELTAYEERDDSEGIVKGWAAVWGNVDTAGDVFAVNAFGEDLDPASVKILNQHDQTQPIGYCTKLENRDYGLWIEAVLLKDKYPKAKEAWDMVKDGLVRGFSVGYTSAESEQQARDGEHVAFITSAKLWEVSLVTIPCNQCAVVVETKGAKVEASETKEKEREDDNMMDVKQLNVELEKAGVVKEADFKALKTEQEKKNAEFEQKAAAMQKDLDEMFKKLNTPQKAVDTKAAELDELTKDLGEFMRQGVRAFATKTTKIVNTADNKVMVPEQISDHLYEMAGDISVMRRVCGATAVSSPDYQQPVVKDSNVSGWRDKEYEYAGIDNALNIEAVSPVFGILDAVVDVSEVALRDSRYDLEKIFADHAAKKIARGEDLAFSKGTGVKQPKGLFTYDTEEKDDDTRAFGKIQALKLTAPTKLTAANVISALNNLIGSLNPAYLDNAAFMMNQNTKTAIMNLVATDGRGLWQPSLVEKQPDRLLGYPVYINKHMDDVAADKVCIAFGDFSAAYLITYIPEMEFTRKTTDQPVVRMVATSRIGGCLMDSNAVKFLKGANA